MHNIVRFNPSDSYRPTSNTFSPDSSTQAGLDYFNSVIGMATVYIALGLSLTLSFLVVFCVACLNRDA